MRTILLFFVGLLPALLLTAPPAEAKTHRFAVIAGNNVGQRHEALLRYAEDDAERVAEVLRELGAFPEDHVRVLKGAGPDAFLAAIADVEAMIAAGGPSQIKGALSSEPVLFVLYFSGHSDGQHLHFGDERLAYKRVQELVERSGASVRLAIVDACRSGSMTRSKGFRFGAAYDLNLVDQLDTRGSAVLTSSAAGEVSQESDALGGSYFTHYLTAGLRGAADEDGDERVTLAEVYSYASGRTAVETSQTLAGPQHPSYEYKLSGRGAVVLTDLALRDATLVFDAALSGTFQILDRSRHTIVGEIDKAPGQPRRYALASGDYAVLQRAGQVTLVQQVALRSGSEVLVRAEDMTRERSVASLVKGNDGAWVYRPARIHGPVTSTGLGWGGASDLAAGPQFQLGYRIDLDWVTLLPTLSYMRSEIDEPEVHYSYQSGSVQLPVLYRHTLRLVDLMIGPALGVSYLRQEFKDTPFERGPFTDMALSYSGIVGAWLPLYSDLAAWLHWETGALVYRLNRAYTQGLYLRGGVGLAWEF